MELLPNASTCQLTFSAILCERWTAQSGKGVVLNADDRILNFRKIWRANKVLGGGSAITRKHFMVWQKYNRYI